VIAVKGGADLHVQVAVKVHDNADAHAHVYLGRAVAAASEFPGKL
jgi:hypothetical protein